MLVVVLLVGTAVTVLAHSGRTNSAQSGRTVRLSLKVCPKYRQKPRCYGAGDFVAEGGRTYEREG